MVQQKGHPVPPASPAEQKRAQADPSNTQYDQMPFAKIPFTIYNEWFMACKKYLGLGVMLNATNIGSVANCTLSPWFHCVEECKKNISQQYPGIIPITKRRHIDQLQLYVEEENQSG
ncbi:uncharacterized protein LOC142336922 isoform X2 [Convolutriloba macropyga]|uniref:uncharacterized protein LOC142336922 isoform X2 n=1 Tax=Convolutriloba macropyga TaxID=536237 RepID=UPI003F522716